MDDVKQWKTQSARAATSIHGLSDQLKKGGTGYIAMDYAITKHAAAVSASFLMPASKLTVPSMPTSLSLWVSGDGNKNGLRASISDRNGKKHMSLILRMNTVCLGKAGDRLRQKFQLASNIR